MKGKVKNEKNLQKLAKFTSYLKLTGTSTPSFKENALWLIPEQDEIPKIFFVVEKIKFIRS